ncbi:GAF and ANTAR domain-containing protein [Skermania sp. ID1734]|uniref:GAF and ANTAR domain-containing protein n=1 Tax=Skermania sp. ID1734 TaxID=2597516 RepID=UPI00117FB508|nr:GAF and ANTAR domain-containing protein [Skermania sp. ID1734]TSD98088.1 GAF and ANTAR domain-containing protein [Skermania sp. ID1734]
MNLDTSGADPATVFAGLAEIVYDRENYEQIHAALCVAATILVPGCDRASMMVRRDGRYLTSAATDPVAASIDATERRLGQGPCVDAIDEETPHLEQDLAASGEWPDLARIVVDTTPVRAAIALRLKTADAKSGALNLFSDTVGGFDDRSVEQAVILAAFASVSLAARANAEEASTLRRGLEHGREIGKALGLVMATHGVDDDGAFAMLTRASQHTNTKIADLARRMIDQHHQQLQH